MPTCTRKGCGVEFDTSNNEEGSCSYHPGGPIFHEGLKSWSCCKDVNKPVLSFDDFMKIPGCTQGKHSLQVPESAPPPVSTTTPSGSDAPKVTVAEDGTETYTTSSAPPAQPAVPKVTATPATRAPPAAPVPLEIEEDDPEAKVDSGAKCKRLGCGAEFVDDATNRSEGGSGAKCTFHPAPPIFHEGSKGYMCCKRRVLEFDEFLKIEGCTTGKHLFVGKAKEAKEELVNCRIDHFQTPREVHVSVYAKKADKDRSTVRFEESSVELDLFLPDHKRFTKVLDLYGPIEAASCSFIFKEPKLDLILVKCDARSWNMLERPREGTPVPDGFQLTFGVGGRTGSIGAKEVVLDEGNLLKRSGVQA